MAPLLPTMSSPSMEERKHILQSIEEKRNSKIPFHVTWTKFMSTNAKNHIVAGIGEFIGTFLFLWFAFAGTAIANMGMGDDSVDVTTFAGAALNSGRLVYISLAFGVSLMINAWVFFRISGGLFNPAVTIALTLLRDITPGRGILLTVVQCGAACFASWLVNIMYPMPTLFSATLSSGTTLVQGLFIEAICTAMLVFTIIMLAKEKHRATFIAPIGIGLAMFIGELASVNFTGGALNPARWLGPAAITRTFMSSDWIYAAGPFIGAVLAVVFYKLFKVMEYEMVNPGQDGDYTNDPTQNPDHELARRVTSRSAQVEELRNIRSEGSFKPHHDRNSNKSLEIRHSNKSLHKGNEESRYVGQRGVDRYRQESNATAYEHGPPGCCGPDGCNMFDADIEAQKVVRGAGRNLM